MADGSALNALRELLSPNTGIRGGEQLVNNFSGGIITEVSPLSFPENSLSKAMNIEIDKDGGIRSRKPFNKVEKTINIQGIFDDTPSFSEKVLKVSKIYWKEKDVHLIVFFSLNSFTIACVNGGTTSFVKIDQTISVGPYTVATVDHGHARKWLEISTNNNQMFFSIRAAIPGGNLISVVYKGVITSWGTLKISNHNQATLVDNWVEIPYHVDQYVESHNNYQITTLTHGAGIPDTYMHVVTASGSVIWSAELSYGLPSTAYQWSLTTPGLKYLSGDLISSSGGVSTYRLRAFVNNRYFRNSKNAQPIYYRDFKGVANYEDSASPFSILGENNRTQYLGSLFRLYNFLNAGWTDRTPGVEVASDESGSAKTAADDGYLAATMSLATITPALSDSIYSFKSSSASTPSVIGLFNPFLLKMTAPDTVGAIRGHHILAAGAEKPVNHFDGNFFGTVHPNFLGGNNISDIKMSGVYSFYPQPNPNFTNFFDHVNQQYSQDFSIDAISTIHGRNWYGCSGRDFNIAYSMQKGSSLDSGENDLSGYTSCYQKGSPASEYGNEVVATDGGTISISNTGRIMKIIEILNNVLVFAENGIWAISGEMGNSFTPTNYSVRKVSNERLLNKNAIVGTEAGIFFLTRTTLFNIQAADALSFSNLSDQRSLSLIKKVAKKFDESDTCGLVYDSSTKRLLIEYQAGWEFLLPQPRAHAADSTCVLVYDLLLNCFYEWTIDNTKWGLGLGNKYLPFESSTTPVNWSLGFVQTLTGVNYLCGSVSSTGAPFNIEFNKIFKFISPSDNFLDPLIDSLSWGRVIAPFSCEFEVPYNVGGDPSKRMWVPTSEFFLSMDGVTGEKDASNNIIRPGLYLRTTWDWEKAIDTDKFLIDGFIKYPQTTNINKKLVEINKYKIPGSGRSLTLTFSNVADKGGFRGFKLLGYLLAIDSSTKL